MELTHTSYFTSLGDTFSIKFLLQNIESNASKLKQEALKQPGISWIDKIKVINLYKNVLREIYHEIYTVTVVFCAFMKQLKLHYIEIVS